ncbi:hypothetical protein [Caproiciproducens sp.]
MTDKLKEIREDVKRSLCNDLPWTTYVQFNGLILVRESLIDNKYSSIWLSADKKKSAIIILSDVKTPDFPMVVKLNGFQNVDSVA